MEHIDFLPEKCVCLVLDMEINIFCVTIEFLWSWVRKTMFSQRNIFFVDLDVEIIVSLTKTLVFMVLGLEIIAFLKDTLSFYGFGLGSIVLQKDMLGLCSFGHGNHCFH